MATWRIAGRSTSTLMRATWRGTTSSTITTSPATITTSPATTRIPVSATNSIRSWTRPNFTLRQSRISPPSPNGRFVRRELSSLLPVHSAIASACLVSKLPSEARTSAEDRFTYYISPI